MIDVPAGEILRCSRLEVLDATGRPRIVLGDLAPTAGFGIAVLDEQSGRRIVASLDDGGPVIAFDLDGTIVLEVGVHDATDDATHVGPYALVNDATGRTVLGVRVDERGEVRVVRPFGAQPDGDDDDVGSGGDDP